MIFMSDMNFGVRHADGRQHFRMAESTEWRMATYVSLPRRRPEGRSAGKITARKPSITAMDTSSGQFMPPPWPHLPRVEFFRLYFVWSGRGANLRGSRGDHYRRKWHLPGKLAFRRRPSGVRKRTRRVLRLGPGGGWKIAWNANAIRLGRHSRRNGFDLRRTRH